MTSGVVGPFCPTMCVWSEGARLWATGRRAENSEKYGEGEKSIETRAVLNEAIKISFRLSSHQHELVLTYCSFKSSMSPIHRFCISAGTMISACCLNSDWLVWKTSLCTAAERAARPIKRVLQGQRIASKYRSEQCPGIRKIRTYFLARDRGHPSR